MAWGVLEEEIDKLDFVFTEFSEDGAKPNVEGVGEHNQKMTLQIEGKSYWYGGLEEPEASQLLKAKGLNLQGERDWKDQHCR